MNYSLGNMLSGGKVLGPALNLQFATDQSLTARRGPTPSFTRASTATFVGSDGMIQSAAINTPRFESDGLLIEPQRTNLITFPINFENAAWNKTWLNCSAANVVTGPDNTLSAETWSEKVANDFKFTVCNPLIVLVGQEYSVSLFVKNGTRQFFKLTASLGELAGNPRCVFDVVNGTIGICDAGIANAEIKAFPNGWYRIYGKMTANTTALNVLWSFAQTATEARSATWAGNVANTLHFYGAQIELGSSVSSLIPTNSTRSADVCTLTIPAGVSSILITYGDNTTATVSVTPGGSYQLPASQKKYKSIVSL
jgi:hypothetical protein